MSLKDRIKDKSVSLVRRETVTLPRTGEQVVVRGLMSGDVLRINAEKSEQKKSLLTIALAVEDPATGRLLWLPHSHEDLEAIEALPVEDLAVVMETSARLSGVGASDKEILGNSPRTQSSSTSSASDSGEPQPS